MKLAFELEVPDGAINLDMSADLVRSLKEQTVLRLYADGRVTVGEASAMLGVTRIQFLDLLQRSGVGFRVDLDDEDFRVLRSLHDDSASKNPR